MLYAAAAAVKARGVDIISAYADVVSSMSWIFASSSSVLVAVPKAMSLTPVTRPLTFVYSSFAPFKSVKSLLRDLSLQLGLARCTLASTGAARGKTT